MARVRGTDRVLATPGTMLTPRTAVFLALAAVLLGLVAIGALTPATDLRGLHGDVALYFEVGERLGRGEVPYRDFPSEYPPLAMVPIALARFLPTAHEVDLGAFAARLLILNTALATMAFALVAWLAARDRPDGWRGAALAGATYAGVALLLGSLVLWRYDILPAVLTAGSLALLVRGRPGWSGVALGAAVAAKLYAAPLAVLFLGWHAARREWAEAARLAAGFVAVGIGVLLPFGIAGLDPTFLRYQLERGLQIESVPAGIAGLGHLLGAEATSSVGFGAVQLESALSGPLLDALGVLAPVAVSMVVVAGLARMWQARSRGVEMVPTLAALSTATLLAVISTNRALSPQYLIWLLPFVPLLSVGPRVLLVVAVAATVVVFPPLYGGLVALEPLPLVLLNLRNGLLVATLVWLVVEQRPALGAVTARHPASPVRTHAAGAGR